eukprot:10094937-Ditylum_brightwellii.AAC.1
MKPETDADTVSDAVLDAVFHPTTAIRNSNNRQFCNNCQRVLFHSTIFATIIIRCGAISSNPQPPELKTVKDVIFTPPPQPHQQPQQQTQPPNSNFEPAFKQFEREKGEGR